MPHQSSHQHHANKFGLWASARLVRVLSEQGSRVHRSKPSSYHWALRYGLQRSIVRKLAQVLMHSSSSHTNNRLGSNDVPRPSLAPLHLRQEILLRVVEVLFKGYKPCIIFLCRRWHWLQVYLREYQFVYSLHVMEQSDLHCSTFRLSEDTLPLALV